MNFSKGYLHVLATIRCPILRKLAVVKFFVDTGSPQSLIGDADVLKINIPTRRLDFKEPALIGGIMISLAEIKNVILHFKGKDFETGKETPVVIKNSTFHVAKNLRTEKRTSYANPSIIGTDFLEEHNMQLFFDPSENVAFLRLPPHPGPFRTDQLKLHQLVHIVRMSVITQNRPGIITSK
ncbi:MAG: pepsin/retropepsin-like aspartic protease family protein [Planctomycetota bacterium]